ARERRIAEHQRLRVEDRRVPGPQRLRHAVAKPQDLLARHAKRPIEPLALVVRRRPGGPVLRDRGVRTAVEDRRATDRDPGGRGHPVERAARHPSSPKRVRISSVSFAAASASSSPWTVKWSLTPLEAASVSRPRIDFPSTRVPSLVTVTFEENVLARCTNFAAA